MEVLTDKNVWVKSLVRYKDKKNWFRDYYLFSTKVRPIQPEITPEEIVEKLGKDYLLNLIKEKENGKRKFKTSTKAGITQN